jgi:hypothetical protein
MKPWLLALALSASLSAQAPNVRLSDESAGIDAIARTLVSAFDQVDIVALGEYHQKQLDSDIRIAMVRDPAFAKKVRSIVVAFASTTEQPTLARYIASLSPDSSAVAKAIFFNGLTVCIARISPIQ